MSAVTSTESITASLAGITVEKTFELDRYPVPAVAYRIRSDRATAAEVRLVEGVPEGVDPADVGFRSSLDGDHWHRGDGELVWHGTVGPGDDVVTCIGVRTDTERDVFRFHGRPQVAAVEAVEGPAWQTTSQVTAPETTPGEAADGKTTAPRGTDRPSPGEWQRAATGPEEETPREAVVDDGAESTGHSRPIRSRATALLRIGLKVALVVALVGGAAML